MRAVRTEFWSGNFQISVSYGEFMPDHKTVTVDVNTIKHVVPHEKISCQVLQG